MSLMNHLTLSKSLHLPRPQVRIYDLYTLTNQQYLAQDITRFLFEGVRDRGMSFKELFYRNDLRFDGVVQTQATNPVSTMGSNRLALSSWPSTT